jgi:hypothetical protein
VFDAAVTGLRHIVDTAEPTPIVNAYVLREVRLRGLLSAGRTEEATRLAAANPPDASGVAPQWQAIERVTMAQIHRAQGDSTAAAAALRESIITAERFRLPHQLQRAVRAAHGQLPEVEEDGRGAIERLRLSMPPARSW